tara:strand:+ start:588 stop:707 length:120 start_codon:yes stop_codon:yes gene_type:complete
MDAATEKELDLFMESLWKDTIKALDDAKEAGLFDEVESK